MKIEDTNFGKMHADLIRQLKNENCECYFKENTNNRVENTKLTNNLAQSILRSTPAIDCNMVPGWNKDPVIWSKDL